MEVMDVLTLGVGLVRDGARSVSLIQFNDICSPASDAEKVLWNYVARWLHALASTRIHLAHGCAFTRDQYPTIPRKQFYGQNHETSTIYGKSWMHLHACYQQLRQRSDK